MRNLKLIAQTLAIALLPGGAIAATQLNCGSTYYVPLVQINLQGVASPLPAGVSLIAQADAAKVAASIGVMPGTTNPAVILKPAAPATGVAVTVKDTNNLVLQGTVSFDMILQTIMIDISKMQSTTP